MQRATSNNNMLFVKGNTVNRQACSNEFNSLSLSTTNNINATITSSPGKSKQSKAVQKAARSKRCKSLLMLSSPFSSSATSSMKMSLLSLLHPNNQSNQHHSLDLCLNKHNHHLFQRQNQQHNSSSTDEENYSTQSDQHLQDSISFSPTIDPYSNLKLRNNTLQTTTTRNKCVKMKLFEQPLEKLFSPKAMKQLSNLINAHYSPSFESTLNKRKRSTSTSVACLRKFSIDLNNNSPSINTNSMTQARRQQLLHSVIPEPIKNLLNELYLRGPSTVGIFRKSPNAKHCKELKHKLETDSLSSIKHFQVTVIASVFKEWLRSLPDCLLMSQLYPQWVDVAKLIEPLFQHQQHLQQLQEQEQRMQHQQVQLQRHQSQSTLSDSSLLYSSDNTVSGNTSLRPSRSPLTDNSQLDRAHSCATISEFSIKNNENNKNFNACDLSSSSMSDSSSNEPRVATTMTTSAASPSSTAQQAMSSFALAERNSECLKIVRQLLDALNEPNLILLRSFICVLWHIANNCEFNKMSANNLGVCVGQSLLNDEHQSNTNKQSLTTSTFTKRHRRTRSQCILSSTLSLTNSNPLQNSGCYLNSNVAQETAKYVPILVGFMIENAQALFGQEITNVFSSISMDEGTEQQQQKVIKSVDVATKMVRMNLTLYKENEPQPTMPLDNQHEIHSFSDEVDSGVTVDDGKQKKSQNDSLTTIPPTEMHGECQPPREKQQQLQPQQIVVASRFKSNNCNGNSGGSECNMVNSNNNRSLDDDNTTTTSILIVNHHSQKRQSHVEESRHRPLSATESTSSSRASSSTSGVHSESPAFSSEVDSQNTRTTNTTSSSPSPSTVSSPSSVTSSSPTSPVQCETDNGHQTNVVESDHHQQEEESLCDRIYPVEQSDSQANLVDGHTTSSKFEPLQACLTECQLTIGKSLVNSSSPNLIDDQASTVRYQNRHTINNRYSSYMGILSRVPKIPVQLTTSNYGGEAIIYNPKPRRNSVDNQQSQQFAGVNLASVQRISNITKTTSEQQVVDLPVECSNQKDSLISVKPVTAATPSAIQKQKQQEEQYQSASTEAQQELREQRLNEFLAHQHRQNQHHHSLVSAPSLPFLSQSNDYNTILRQQQHHPIVSQQQQATIANNINYLQQYQRHQQQQAPVFYSTANLSSLQQHQHYQQDRYLLYHRSSLEPQRSHVMSLRDYYLSLEQQNKQQQQHGLMRESFLHRQQRQQQQSRFIPQQQQPKRAATINELRQPSQQQKQNEHHQHIVIAHRQYLVGQQHQKQPFSQAQSNVMSNGLTTHQAIHRPQPRLAKIRQNQFSGVYVKNTSQTALNTGVVAINTSSSQATSATTPAGVVPASRIDPKVNNIRQMSSSSDHSSDESDEYINEWMESTMV